MEQQGQVTIEQMQQIVGKYIIAAELREAQFVGILQQQEQKLKELESNNKKSSNK